MSSHQEEPKSLAILPFQSQQGRTSSLSSLSDGLAETLTVRLQEFNFLKITPSSKVRKNLSQTKDSFKLGTSLNVDYILEGFIFSSSNRTRFTVQLLRIADQSVIWAAQFDEKEKDAFRLQDLLAERIAMAILPHLQNTGKDPVTDAVLTQNTDEIENEQLLNYENRDIPNQKTDVKKTSNSLVRYAVLALLAALLLLFGFYLWNSLKFGQQSNLNVNNKADNRSLIVLPFQNSGSLSDDDALGIGFAESLTGNLGVVEKLFVLSANAGRDAARKNIPAWQIGRDYRTNYILRGNLNHNGGNKDGVMQIYAELLETSGEQKVVWSKTFDLPESELGDVSGKITAEILQTLGIEANPTAAASFARKPTANGLAYELYLAGRFQMAARNDDGLHRAMSSFNQAIAKDSQFALAYSGLADAYSLENLYEFPPPPDAYQKAREYAAKSLSLNENSSEAHNSMAYVLFYYEHDRVEAEREFKKAIELNPSNATAHHWYSGMLSAVGRHEEALAEIELAQRLDPFSAVIASAKGIAYFYARNYEQAIAECNKALSLNEGLIPALRVVRWTNQAKKDYAAARAAYVQEKNFSDGSGDNSGWLPIEAQIEALRDKNSARKILEKSLASDEIKNNQGAYAVEIALAYAYLNEPDKAFEWLEKGEKTGAHIFNYLEVDPLFDSLRSDRRFADLVQRIKTPK